MMDGTDASHRDRELETPLRISISKSQAVVRYPVVYFQSFNAAPYEVVTHHGLGGCDDGDLSLTQAAVGFLRRMDQEFKTVKVSAAAAAQTKSWAQARHQLVAQPSSAICLGPRAVAHCLRMNELWYAAYTLGTPQLHFSITVEARQHNGTMAEYTLDLSLKTPVKRVRTARSPRAFWAI